MKVIIAGSRSIRSYNIVKEIIRSSGFHITEVVSGMAKGIDRLGVRYAIENSIPIKLFPISKEDWKNKGKAAGPFRNRLMGDYAEALIAIWDGHSSGTKDMIEYARGKGLQFFVKIISERSK